MHSINIKPQANVRKILLAFACIILSSAGGLWAQKPLTLRPVDTGKSVVFNLGAGDTYDRFSVKTNVLYWATLSPNLALEVALGEKTSLEMTVGFSSVHSNTVADETTPDRKEFKHFLIKPEFKYWFQERMDGFFVGLHALWASYKIEGIKVPALFEKGYAYDGSAFGGGVAGGYLWRAADRFGVEFNVAAGIVQMKYDKKPSNGEDPAGLAFNKTYVGPTGAGIKLIFMIK